jgi:hypothetical protein
MNSRLQECALIAEIAGGIAVIISVVYLAIQISDNNRLLKSQAHFNGLVVSQEMLRLRVEDEALSKLIDVCDQDPTVVDRSEWERCADYYFIQFNGWEYLYYQNIDRSIPSQFWVGADAWYKELLRSRKGYSRFWRERAIGFDEPFRGYVQSLVDSLGR